MNVRFTLLFSLFILALASPKTADAQCESGSSGLAVIQLESPTNLSDLEPLIPGQQYDLEFFYNYLFTGKGQDCIDEESVLFVSSPPGAVSVVSGPTVMGSSIFVSIVPQNDNFTMRITADDCPASTALSCASLPIRELTVPVDFRSIEASPGKDNQDVILSWSTLSEVNNDYFEIQRTDGNSAFVTLGTVTGSGNSSELVEYSFVDDSAEVGVNYYRLKQVDLDGGFAFSDVVSAEVSLDEPVVLTPNPAVRGGDIRVIFDSRENNNGGMNLTIFNVAGKTVVSKDYPAQVGSNTAIFQNDLPKGIYIARVNIGTESVSKKIVIQ